MTKISVKFDIEIENIDKFIDYMEKSIPRAFTESSFESLDKGRQFAKEMAKTYVPVDTGALKKSIRLIPIEKTGWHEKIYSGGISAGGYVRNPKTNKLVHYQTIVEYGNSRQRPQPYMRPALDKAMSRLGRFFRDSILRRLERG